MSGATGAAGGATGGLPGAGQGGAPYGGVPPRPAEHPGASTSVMPQVPAAQSGGQGGFSVPPPPSQPPAPPSVPPAAAAPGSAGFSQPTTYAKGQPTPARGTRTNQGTQGGGAVRRSNNAPAAGPAGRVRKARLRVTKADPWSVMKVSFLLSLAVGVIIIVATAVLWLMLDGLGVFSSLASTLKDVTGSGNDSSSAFNLMDYIGFGPVMTFAVVIAVVDVVLMTALSTLSAFIYNTAAGFTGGIELTLAEED